MSSAIPDPWFPGTWIVPGSTLVNVHDPSQCVGEACCIHQPSDHPMATWPLAWRNDWGLMERICWHGIGHPDPDDVAYKRRLIPGAGFDLHSCDGCCRA